MTASEPPPRAAVRSLVRKVVEHAQVEDRGALLAQADTVQYVDGPITMMRLRVPSSSAPARSVENPVPGGPTVVNDDGDVVGGLLLWLDEVGYIECLEYWWVTEEMPTALPDPSHIRSR